MTLFFRNLFLLIAFANLVSCGGGSGDTKVVTVPAADSTAPLVLITTPANNTTGVALNTVLTATFSETINPATLTATTFSVSGVPGTVTLSGDNRSASFMPSAALAPNTSYTASLTTGVQDAAGNALTGNASWSFTTGAAADTTAPLVSSVSPLHGSKNNPASVSIAANFDEAINCTTVTTSNVQLLEGSTTTPIQVGCSGNTLTLLPIQGMPTDTLLTASIGPSVRDLASNPLANVTTWSFGMAPWTRQLGSAGGDYANAITSDAAGNVYAAGYTNGALDGQTSAGGDDLFITKYNSSGVKQWTRQLGSAGHDYAFALTSDAAGNVYAAGSTLGALDGQTSAGLADLFITKYDSSGVKQWTRQLGSAVDDVAYAITSDAAGNVYAAGMTAGALDGQTSAGATDLFITKYNSSGVKQWTRQLGSAGTDYAQAITSDAAGNVYAAGYTYGVMPDVPSGTTNAGFSDLFITKYNSSGVKQWTRQLGSAGTDYAQAITSDAAGNVYAAGYTTGGLDGQASAGGDDLFIVKYQADGRKR